MMSLIKETFKNIPVNEILRIAGTVKVALKNDPDLIWLKDKDEYVTQADIQIQKCLLEYFAKTGLSGNYIVKTEEELSLQKSIAGHADAQLQLIIDPLDGTNSFCRGEESWGVMVGVCDQEGRLIYSWNLLSDGEVFSSSTVKANASICNWSKTLQSQQTLKIDIYDYGAGAAERFPRVFESNTNKQISKEKVEVASCSSAVWAGWELYSGKLNGLLWLPSDQGKRSYPDCDLCFLGALKEQGWKIALGKQRDVVQMVVVAPTEGDLQMLWDTGASMLNPARVSSLTCNRDLQITSVIKS